MCCTYFQIVLVRDKKKVFTMDDHGYEATVGAIHPGGTTVAIGGEVSGRLCERQIDEKVSELWATACLGVLTMILFEVCFGAVTKTAVHFEISSETLYNEAFNAEKPYHVVSLYVFNVY